MEQRIVRTTPFPDQQPGTAGLRRKVSVFRQPGYLENFLQAIFDSAPALRGGRIVVGGDGRFFNRDAIQVLLRMAAANGIASVALARSGLLSTPAASLAIAAQDAAGGFILTASHNPAGPDGDWGIKFNVAGGGQASETLTDAIMVRTRTLSEYRIMDNVPDVDIDWPGSVFLGEMRIDVFDPVMLYADRMESIFDFVHIRSAVENGLTLRFDAMNAVTGPYAHEIFVRRLGMSELSLVNATPRDDFGGLHADPHPHTLPDLVRLAASDHAPDLLAASDGDGDRNFIAGPGIIVSPCDSLAVITANAHLIRGYRDGITGVARSMPTSRAVDRVAAKIGIPCYETPTGWRYFCNLLETGHITLCGEESFGTSSNHCREKDGLWAVLCWLDLLASTGLGVREILSRHWNEYGRTFFVRNDYAIADGTVARSVMQGLRESLGGLPGRSIAGREVLSADEFAYDDPVDGSHSAHQGLRVNLAGDARIVYRLSGTDSSGATLRIYLEDHTDDHSRFGEDAAHTLAMLAEAARDLARITPMTGLSAPTLVI